MESTIAPQAAAYSDISPDQFEARINQQWQAAAELKDTVIQQVREQQLTPYQGAAIVSCVVGQVFGYQEFHRELRPADLLSTLGQTRR